MKTQVSILEQTKEDLVNLLSTALYGSNYLSADYEESIEYDEDDSYEEIMAEILLNGGKILITDHYAEVGEVYGNLPCEVKKDEENEGCWITTYFVTLKDIVSGLTKAANGTFNTGVNENCFGTLTMSGDYQDRVIEFAKRSFNAFAFDEREWDYNTADCLMQIILFNEIVYG